MITVIPKKTGPMEPSDYRPISIVHSIQKILSKTLARRIAPLMNSLISQNQSGFIKGRCISDNFLCVQQMVHHCHKRKIDLAVYKADLNKAFDTLDWSFILKVLTALGFSQKWNKWIEGCVLQGTSTVLINGIQGKSMHLRRGVRQGDCLSPLLFVLAFDFLSRWLAKLNTGGHLIMPFSRMHQALFYADDSIIMFKPTLHQAQTLITALQTFQQLSGLVVNNSKSEIVYIHTDPSSARQISSMFKCKTSTFPITYLGIPLSHKKLPMSAFDPLLEKFKSRLTGWSATLLSQAGRITLINSCLTAMPVYIMSVLLLPKQVIKKLDAIRRNFFWHGTDPKNATPHMIRWQHICKPREIGGLGIKEIYTFNMALHAKHLLSWMTAGNNPYCDLWNILQNGLPSPIPVTATLQPSYNFLKPVLCTMLRFSPSSSNHILLWEYNWGNGILRTRLPELWSLTMHKNITLSEALAATQEELAHTMNLPISNLHTTVASQFTQLRQMLHQTAPHRGDEVPLQRLNLSLSSFVSSQVYKFLTTATTTKFRYSLVWKLKLPPRISLFMWKVMLNKLPTYDNLRKKGWVLPNYCFLCKRSEETLSHLFIECDYILSLLQHCKTIGRLQLPGNLNSQSCWHSYCSGDKLDSQFKKTMCTIALIYYQVWKERCTRIFTNSSNSPTSLAQLILEHWTEWLQPLE